jgi:hypothetical protein
MHGKRKNIQQAMTNEKGNNRENLYKIHDRKGKN